MKPRFAAALEMLTIVSLGGYVEARAASPGATDEHGFRVHEIRSEFQAGATQIRVLAPNHVPYFSDLPWYADHPSDPTIRQESYLLRAVIPWVEQSYSIEVGKSGRLLLGFSKSGWGAWSLLLRHPETFGRATAGNAPVLAAVAGLPGIATPRS